MNTNIYHTVNAGLFFQTSNSGILIDGLHDGCELGFSNMPAFLQEQLENYSGIFAHTDAVLFTHMHPDHYSSEKLELLHEKKPDLRIYGPGIKYNNIKEEVLSKTVHLLKLPGCKVLIKNTIHDGEAWKYDWNQSFLIRIGSEQYFIAGDAKLGVDDALEFLPFISGPLQYGFFNLYQLNSDEGRAFIQSMPFERIGLYHLPFKQDDTFHYRQLARQLLRNMPEGLPPLKILNHLEWINNN